MARAIRSSARSRRSARADSYGKGFGLGSLKRGSIPEVQSDFIFAAWTEETGFVGAMAVLALFGFVAWRAFRVAFSETDSYRSYLGMGMAFLLSLETLVNAAVVAGASYPRRAWRCPSSRPEAPR